MPHHKSLLFLALCLTVSSALGEEWPKWRGPRGDGISRETGLLDKWPEDGPKKVWSAAVGLGFSSPIAVDGKVYLMTLDDDKESLSAFDAGTGKVIWTQSYVGGFTRGDSYPGSRATPTIDGKFIYTYGGVGDLVCRDLADGKEVWHDNILQSTRTTPLTWGEASSPLVTNTSIYVQCGQGGPIAVCLDKATGQITWKSEASGLSGYAAPILMTVGGARQLFVFAGATLCGMDPATGKTLWSEPWQTDNDVNASTPIADGDKVFISSGYNHGAAQYQVSANGAKQVWMNSEVASRFPGAVLDGGYLYCVSEDRSGTLKCLSWADGSQKWAAAGGRKMKLGFGGSFVRFSDRLLTMSDSGMMSLMQATPAGVSLISQTQVFDSTFSKVWSTPLIYHGKVYLKGQNELICFDISGGGAGQ
jgi:outer membrane protein assembly factor BamB